MECKSLAILNNIIEYKEIIIKKCNVLKISRLPKATLYDIIDTRLLNAQGWIALIQLLCFPEARYHAQTYRLYLKWLLETKRLEIDPETYYGQCIYLWSEAPFLLWNKLSELDYITYGHFIGTIFERNIPSDKHTQYHLIHPTSRFAPCPYCILKADCHFKDEDNKCNEFYRHRRSFCVPEAGLHVCYHHGRKHLSQRSSVHSMNDSILLSDGSGRECTNIRKFLDFKDNITHYGDLPFIFLREPEEIKPEKTTIVTAFKNIINETKTKFFSINPYNSIKAEENVW